MPIATGNSTLQLLLLFLLIIIALFATLARRWDKPYPILLVLAGLGLSFVPHMPRLPLNPEIIFNVFLPPLLYAAAWQTNYREFRRQIVPISMLATGLVFFTVFGVAFLAPHFIRTLDFRTAFLLGAIVAATDAVAATSIAKTLGLERRIVTILEGESLINDATALLALEVGLNLLLDGKESALGSTLLRLTWLAAGGIGVGLLVGRITFWIERWIDGGPLEMLISIIVPYVAYLGAEEVRASGVLAVVACGLLLSRRSSQFLSAPARLELLSAWAALDFLLNGAMFALIGLQLPEVLAGIRFYSSHTLIGYGFAFSLILIALRMAWVFPGSRVSRFLRIHLFHERAMDVPAPSPRSVFVVGWTGMRGVVSLAAALSLPFTLPNGEPFQQRNLIIFLTFAIILVTLVLQGLSLPAVIRALGLEGEDHEEERELMYAVRVTSESAIQFLQQRRAEASPEEAHDIDDLLHKYEHQLEAVRAKSAHVDSPDEKTEAELSRHTGRRELLRETIRVEREALSQLRDTSTIGDESARRVERSLDLAEARFEQAFE